MVRPMRYVPVTPFAAPESLADFAALDNGQLALTQLDAMADNRRRAALAAFIASGEAITPIVCRHCDDGYECVSCCSLADLELVCCSVCGYPSLASVRGACDCPEGADWVPCPADTLADL